MQVDLREAGDRAEQDVLDARLAGRRDRHRVAVAAHPLRDPEDVDLLNSGHWAPPSIVKRVHEQLLAADQLHVQAPARRAGQREAVAVRSRPRTRGRRRRRGPLPARSSAPSASVPSATRVNAKASASGTTWRRCPTLHLDASRSARPPAWAQRDPHDGVGDRELVHQQILGSGSPTSSSITRLPPKLVSTSTIPGGSVLDLADRRRSPARAAQRSRRRRSRTKHALVGDVHRVDAEQLAGAGDRGRDRHGGLADEHRDARGARELVEHGGDAAAGGVAHARATPPAPSSASTAGHSERVSDSIVGVELELAAREHDRRAVLADRAGEQDAVAGPRAARSARARVAPAEPGRA